MSLPETTLRPQPARPPVTEHLSRVTYGGAAGLVVFAAFVAVGGALDAGYSPMREAMSALGASNAEHPMTFTVGVMALGVGALSMAATFGCRLSGRAAHATVVLLVLAGLAMGVDGLAREDCSTALAPCAALEEAGAVSTAHTVHELVGLLGFLCVVAAAFTLARALRSSARTAALARHTKRVGFVLGALVVLLVVNPVPAGGGLVQRAFVALAFGWPAYVAITTRRGLSTDASRASWDRSSRPG